MDLRLHVDARVLQLQEYRARGIGQHFGALLRARKHSAFAACRTIALTDPSLPSLPESVSYLFDEITRSVNPIGSSPGLFIDGCPITQDPRFDPQFNMRFVGQSPYLSAAVTYDFIPLDWPGYLPTVASRMAYLAKMARLRKFDVFLPISEYTAWRTSELLGISRQRQHVTGASVRESIYRLANELRMKRDSAIRDPYFAIVIASDPRKNSELAIKAVRQLNLDSSRRVRLKVVGHYDSEFKARLLNIAGPNHQGFLELCPEISDEELVALYAGATATIVPSHIEGFSLPVVEAAVCGCPVIASSCAAHLELVDQPEALFESHDAAALARRMESILNDPSLGKRLVEGQAHLRGEYHEDAVGHRFWEGISVAVRERDGGVERHVASAAINTGRLPRLAFLSPFPPDPAGPSFYTANTLAAATDLFEADLYSDSPRPFTSESGFRDLGVVTAAPVTLGGYDAVISVLGNSPFHTRIFDVFERFGGPCILHDPRLVDIYARRMGWDKFLPYVSRLAGHSVSKEEVNAWTYRREQPTLLLEPVIERAEPLIVHTVTQQAEIKKRYGFDAAVNACCSNLYIDQCDLTAKAKRDARERLRVRPGSFMVSTFGYVHKVKGVDTCILAVDLLRSWNVPIELYLVGDTYYPEARNLAATFGVSEYIHFEDGFVSDEKYRDYLVASDAGIQLRTYGFGQFSCALADCINAALPTVANTNLALSCDAPNYVVQVPDVFSPLQVAEELATVWGNYAEREVRMDVRNAHLETHNFHYYAKRLLEILGLT